MIEIVKVANRDEGNIKAHEILKTHVDGKTILALSGGRSPDYRTMVVDDGDIRPGAICIVDERFGEPYNPDSNELLIKDAGVESYAKLYGIQYETILSGKTFKETALDYEIRFARLLAKNPKRIGIMGVGENLHTAGIFPNGVAVKSQNWVADETFDARFPKRITLTLKALAQFQIFIVLVFDATKKPALLLMTRGQEKNVETFPALYYKNSTARTYLVTSVEI